MTAPPPVGYRVQLRRKNMKTFEIDVRRTSFITLLVDAENEQEAEKLAWHKIQYDPVNDDHASWDIESIEEVPA